MKKQLAIIGVLALSIVCMCGCASTCANCENEIESDAEIAIGDETYCKDCVEYCADCDKALVKDSKMVYVYEDKHYCKECFEKEAYPIVLSDTDKYSMSIIGYDDEEGTFAIKIENKTEYNISTYQEGESALLDGSKKCIPETDGSYSFAYADVPANEDITIFSSFRVSDEDWDTVLKMSDGHTFELAMVAWIDDENYTDFWDDNFKVELKPEMFGYAK